MQVKSLFDTLEKIATGLTPITAVFITLKAAMPIGLIICLNVLFGQQIPVNLWTYAVALLALYLMRPRHIGFPIMMSMSLEQVDGGMKSLPSKPKPFLSLVKNDVKKTDEPTVKSGKGLISGTRNDDNEPPKVS